MKKEIYTKAVDKITDNWLYAMSKYNAGSSKEESFECIVVILVDYKVLSRHNTIILLPLKSMHIVQYKK